MKKKMLIIENEMASQKIVETKQAQRGQLVSTSIIEKFKNNEKLQTISGDLNGWMHKGFKSPRNSAMMLLNESPSLTQLIRKLNKTAN